ncbi:hypothetical protein BH09BAC5_BH09BAC5_11150 [soil metagenome]
MKIFIFLVAAFLINSIEKISAQTEFSDDTLEIISKAEGRNTTETNAFIQYWHTKESNRLANSGTTPVSPALITNSGFENGDFSGWTGTIGDNTASSYSPLQNIQSGIFSTTINANVNSSTARHTIMTAAGGNDSLGGFPVAPANLGNFTARLGGITPNYQGETMEQTMLVDLGTPYINVSFAIVLQNPVTGHASQAKPYFKYELLDTFGIVFLSKYIAIADTILLRSSIDTTIQILPWKTDSLDLTPYIGQTITLRYTVAGCTQSGHFGYCYIDATYPYVTSVAENTTSFFSISPNPGTGIFNINVAGSSMENQTILISDVLGNIIAPTIYRNANGWRLDMTGMKPGMYFIEISSGENRNTQRLIVE